MSAEKELIALVSRLQQEAYNHGVQDTIKRISDAASNIAPTEKKSPIQQGAQRRGHVIGLVKDTIYASPGLKGSEIVKRLQDNDKRIMERTVRTSFLRLKEDGIIESRDRKWYPAQ